MRGGEGERGGVSLAGCKLRQRGWLSPVATVEGLGSLEAERQ